MSGITSAMAATFKQEMLIGGHCLQGAQSFTGNTHSNTTIEGIASTANLVVGMFVAGGGIPAGAVIATIPLANTITIGPGATTSSAGDALTFTGDTINMALIKYGMAGTYDARTSNYANVTTNTDEASGAGYVAGGQAITQVSPSIPGSNTATVSFSPNPSWTGATVDVAGCILYNTTYGGAVTNRAISVHDFGGEQKTTAGTLTINMPTNDASNAILRIQ